jgi:hypothetical protein
MHKGQIYSPTASLCIHYSRDGKVADTPRRTVKLLGFSFIVAPFTGVIYFAVNVAVVMSLG